MAEHQLPKLNTRVRFPSSAPLRSLGVGVEILVCRGDPVHPVGQIAPHQSEASKSAAGASCRSLPSWSSYRSSTPAAQLEPCPHQSVRPGRHRNGPWSSSAACTEDMRTALAYSGVGAPGESGTFLGDRSRPASASTTSPSSTITRCRRSGTASSARSNPRTSATGTPRHWSTGRQCGRTSTACCGPSSLRSPGGGGAQFAHRRDA